MEPQGQKRIGANSLGTGDHPLLIEKITHGRAIDLVLSGNGHLVLKKNGATNTFFLEQTAVFLAIALPAGPDALHAGLPQTLGDTALQYRSPATRSFGDGRLFQDPAGALE